MTVETNIGKLILHYDGTQSLTKPIYEVTENDGIGTLRIQARTEKEAYQLLRGAKSKYPNLDVDEVMKQMQVTDDYTPRIVNMSIELGGEECGRSVVKSCLALASFRGIDIDQCSPADHYLNYGGSANFGGYYDSDLVLNRPPDSIFHCVAVTGNSKSQMLLGYVEYFSVQRVVVCLSDTYEGDDFESMYAIDPRDGNELELKVDLSFSKADVAAICDYKRASQEGMHFAVGEVMRIGYAASLERQKNKVLGEAVDYGLANCGAKEGDILTEEHLRKLSQLIAEKMTPYLLQRIKK
ncbi:hypothetical protein FHW67_001732 [Herbaspirillum sp. Sphag1AN]|uniref:hypothetical protein n=1 Tax=unclassified Herbaspirillum TaxID=2624150 RepID=UPI001608CEC2|nr:MULTISPECIES: hypothetical protein [unclassified Herbaspirillum]MBB3212452.1 hypothetical protein [Herbaspirillum sp. Sphag1AN]MBB3245449.1 hypothetical protein [Herbaspirillum sp. Sphag64]